MGVPRTFPVEAVKKWDWLRADVGVLQRFRVAARCLSQFFHSLVAGATGLSQCSSADRWAPVRKRTSYDPAGINQRIRRLKYLYLFAMRLLAGDDSVSGVATVDGKNRDLQCNSWKPNGLIRTTVGNTRVQDWWC